MGMYRQYTITKTVPLPVIFKCQHCQKDNIILHPFAVQAGYNDKGTFSKNAVKDRENAAREYLAEQERELYYKVSDATERRSFKNAGYVCSCTHCKKVPLWSNYPVKLLDSIGIIATFVAFILALIWCRELFGTPLPLSELMPALKVLVFGNLPALIVYTIKGIRVRSIAKEYMPVVFKNTEHLKQTMMGIKQ